MHRSKQNPHHVHVGPVYVPTEGAAIGGGFAQAIAIAFVGPHTGDVTFVPSPNDATVTSYQINVYQYGTTTIVANTNIGHPAAVGGIITVDLTTFFGTIAPGNYDVTVVAIAPGGSTESTISNAFSLPLS